MKEEFSTRFDSLYQWMNRKYGLQLIQQEIGGECLQLYQVADVDEALNMLMAGPAEPRAPYWMELWPSSLALAQFVGRRPNLKGKRVAELGCGMALPGIVAGRRGAQVVLTDIEEDALRLAELNWLTNMDAAAEIRLIDWRHAPEDPRFDLLLASNLAYEKELFAPLIETFDRLLLPEGEIFLSEPNRPIAAEFFEDLQRSGFQAERFDEIVEYRERTVSVAVHQLRRG